MSDKKGDILIVDDTPNNLKFLSNMLTERNYKVRSVTTGPMALTVAEAALPDLILLDIKMPEMGGYEVCRRLKSQAKTQEIPVIFLSALDEAIDKVQAFQVGGVDYITKPFQLEEVIVRIDTQLQLRKTQDALQRLNSELEMRVRQRTMQLEQEISARQKAQAKLLHMALHDSLTELPNRAFFMKRLKQVLKGAKQHADAQFAVLFLDCDRFKVINDSLGHLVGDQLLIAMARRLESCVPPGTTIARLGGDEFILLLENIDGPESSIRVAERIQSEIRLPFQLENHEFYTTVSIGIVIGHRGYAQPEHLLRDADAAMYRAKESGKGRYAIFHETLHHQLTDRFHLETELQRAVKRGEFLLHYQPIVDLKTRRLNGFEALVRWQHPDRGLIPPNHFIPIAEDSGIIEPIDLWVMTDACRQLEAWQSQNLVPFPFRLGVNFSARHFVNPTFIEQIEDILERYRVDGQLLKLEITERELMKNAISAIDLLEQLKRRRIQVAIDDFGTGYSSLSYLQRFPVDALKIDRSFVAELELHDQNAAIVRAIVALADSLGMSTIAEGVENQAQCDALNGLGCRLAQGFFFSRPVDADTATQLLRAQPTGTSPVEAQ